MYKQQSFTIIFDHLMKSNANIFEMTSLHFIYPIDVCHN